MKKRVFTAAFVLAAGFGTGATAYSCQAELESFENAAVQAMDNNAWIGISGQALVDCLVDAKLAVAKADNAAASTTGAIFGRHLGIASNLDAQGQALRGQVVWTGQQQLSCVDTSCNYIDVNMGPSTLYVPPDVLGLDPYSQAGTHRLQFDPDIEIKRRAFDALSVDSAGQTPGQVSGGSN